MRTSDRYEIEIILSEIKESLPQARWEWDGNRQSVSARLEKDEWKQAEKKFKQVFSRACRSKRQAERIPVAKSILRLHGGLGEGYAIWSSDPTRPSGIWSLSAPWPDGESCTLFLGAWSNEDMADRQLCSSIRNIFGIH